jgi:hypothetical protein
MRLAIDEISLVRYPPKGGSCACGWLSWTRLWEPMIACTQQSRLVVFPLGLVPAWALTAVKKDQSRSEPPIRVHTLLLLIYLELWSLDIKVLFR